MQPRQRRRQSSPASSRRAADAATLAGTAARRQADALHELRRASRRAIERRRREAVVIASPRREAGMPMQKHTTRHGHVAAGADSVFIGAAGRHDAKSVDAFLPMRPHLISPASNALRRTPRLQRVPTHGTTVDVPQMPPSTISWLIAPRMPMRYGLGALISAQEVDHHRRPRLLPRAVATLL